MLWFFPDVRITTRKPLGEGIHWRPWPSIRILSLPQWLARRNNWIVGFYGSRISNMPDCVLQWWTAETKRRQIMESQR